MFRVKVFKSQIKNWSLILAWSLLMTVGLFGVGMSSLAADVDIEQLKFQKTQLQEKLQDLNSQINKYQGQISDTRKKQASLKNEIAIYDAQVQSVQLQIQAKETEIEDANLQIKELQKQIERRRTEITENKKVLRELIVELAELSDNSFLSLALGSQEFSAFLDQLQYTSSLQDKVYEIVKNIKAVKQKLEEQQANLKVEKEKLEKFRQGLQADQTELEAQERDRQNLLDRTRGVERNYQALLAKSQNEQDDLEKEIDDLDAKVRARLGPKKVAAKKGSLAQPMEGVLTQGYGNTGFRSLGYSFHNGIDKAAPAGTPIYAAADGVVNGCDNGEAAYGNWCTVKHQSVATTSGSVCLVTLYAHMRSIKVSSGQAVKEGDLIGYEGNSGNTTRLLYGPHRGYHLHFTVFDCDGFAFSAGKYSSTYGRYTVPYGYTYNPMDFL